MITKSPKVLVVCLLLTWILSAGSAKADTYSGFNLGGGGDIYTDGTPFGVKQSYYELTFDTTASFDWQAPSVTFESLQVHFGGTTTQMQHDFTIGPGQTETITLTVNYDPVDISVGQVGPVPLYAGTGGEYTIDDLIRYGSVGAFGDFTLTGSYELKGPTQTLSDTFSIQASNSSAIKYFSWDSINTTMYPTELLLAKPGNTNNVTWMCGYSTYEIQGIVDGHSVSMSIGHIRFNPRGSYSLTPIPEPATMSLLALGSFPLLRRRRKQ